MHAWWTRLQLCVRIVVRPLRLGVSSRCPDGLNRLRLAVPVAGPGAVPALDAIVGPIADPYAFARDVLAAPALLGLGRRRRLEGLRHLANCAREVGLRVGGRRVARLTASGTAQSLGISKRTPCSSAASTSPLHPDVGVRPVQDDADSLRREREELQCLQAQPDVLDRRHVEPAQEQQLVRAVERRQHRPVEERRGVDDDHLVRLLGHLEQPAELRLGDEARRPPAGLAPAGPRRPLRAGSCSRRASRVELARRDDQVVDRLVGLDTEHDRGVSELEVKVEEQRLLSAVLRERRGEVRRHDGLAGPALGRGRSRRPSAPVVAERARVARLADCEDDVVGELRGNRTSATSASRAASSSSDASPEASAAIGARVYSRMAARSSSGSSDDRVACSTA